MVEGLKKLLRENNNVYAWYVEKILDCNKYGQVVYDCQHCQ